MSRNEPSKGSVKSSGFIERSRINVSKDDGDIESIGFYITKNISERNSSAEIGK